MSLHEIPIEPRPDAIRLVRTPTASAAQIIRAVIIGLFLAFFFVWALPQARELLAGHTATHQHALAWIGPGSNEIV